MSGWDDPNVMSNNRKPRIDDKSQVLKYPPDEYVDIRLLGPLFSIVFYWFEIKTKDGKKVTIPKLCLDYDPIKQKFTSDICPYRASGLGRMQQVFYSNAIVRDLQRLAPKKEPKRTRFERKPQPLIPGSDEKWYIKELGTKSYTPVRLVKLPSSLMEGIIKLAKLNKHKVKGERKTFPVAHMKYGMDVSVSFDPNASGSNMYDVQKGDPSSITDEEKQYLMQPFFTEAIKPESLKEAKKEMSRIVKVVVNSDKDEKEDKEDKNKKRRNKKNRSKDSDDDTSSTKRGKSKSRKDKSRKDKSSSKDKKSSNKSSKKKNKNKKSSWADDDIPF